MAERRTLEEEAKRASSSDPHGDDSDDEVSRESGDSRDDYEREGDDADVDGDMQQADDDDDDRSALQKAARAGIRLLEENAQLADEVRHLQQQVAHAEQHTRELQRALEERDARIEKLSQHLREAIHENHGVLAELSRAKEQLADSQSLVAQLQAAQQRSPRRRMSRIEMPVAQQVETRPTLALDASGGDCEGCEPVSGDKSTFAAVRPLPIVTTETERRASAESVTPSSAFGGRTSPRRRQVARLEEAEEKYEEAHRRNNILKRELLSAQKKVSELKPLSAQLQEANEELRALRGQVDKLHKQLQMAHDERAEESALIQSLRTTVEIYQSLDDPTRSAKLHHHHAAATNGHRSSLLPSELSDEPQARQMTRMRRRRSDTCVALSHTSFKSPVCWTNASVNCPHTQDDAERDMESLGSLADQLLSLQQYVTHFTAQRSSAGAGLVETSKARDDSSLLHVSTEAHARGSFQEQQLHLLHDLLRRYRAQGRHASELRSALEAEKARLLNRIEALSLLAQRQCEMCARANEELAQESETWRAAASAYESLLKQATESADAEDEDDAEHLCFSILRRLVDSWTADRSKRMRLHDWLTNAIRSTGNRKSLYLPDLSDELASGFQMLLVPILREKFGVDVHVEKRLRNVVVTDLKLHIVHTDADKAKACLQRISRSLMWIVDVEAAQLEESEWLGEFSRKRAARMCLGK